MSHHVYHAQMHLRLRVDRFNSFGEALEAIHTRDEDVRDAPVLQLRDDLHPELCAFRVSRLHAEDFFQAL